MGKKIVFALILLILGFSGLIAATYFGKTNFLNGEQETDTSNNTSSNQLDDKISPMNEAKKMVDNINATQMSPEEIIARSFEALDLVDGLHIDELSAETQFFTDLYSVLIAVYEKTDTAPSTRSEAVVGMNKVGYLSTFDPVPMNNALKAFDNGRLYQQFIADPYTSDTPVGVAYKAWYHFNNQNYESSGKDPYFEAFAVWTIAIALIANQPDADWRDDFMSYIVDKYELVWPNTFDTRVKQLDQVLWLQTTLLISRMRLESVYEEDVAYTMEDYKKRFQQIIQGVTDDSDPMILQLGHLGMLVMLNEKKATPEEIAAATQAFIASAGALEEDWFSVKNRTAQNEQGFLLRKLGEIAKTSPELKLYLESKGWQL